MYVRPECRGLGAAKQLLQFLERETLKAGRDRLMLETGILQPEALGLYERWGFVRRGPFGDYAEDPLSVFMEKALR
jgi:putative acetyltransferase